MLVHLIVLSVRRLRVTSPIVIGAAVQLVVCSVLCHALHCGTLLRVLRLGLASSVWRVTDRWQLRPTH